jgi:hypothetical protein
VSTCNTSGWRQSTKPWFVWKLLVVRVRALIAMMLLASGCKSVAKDEDPPTPVAMAAPDASPMMDVSMVGPTGPVTPPSTPMDQPTGPSDAGMAADDDAGADELPPADGGPWKPVDPTCEDGEWLLAQGFLPAKQVDYIADRDMRFVDPGAGMMAGFGGAGGAAGAPQPAPIPSSPVPVVISEAGMACANARDRAKCEAALKLSTPFGRHLVSTSGDAVRVWPFPGALQLLGAIDTPAEAVWVALLARGNVVCSATVTEEEESYVVGGLPNFSCPSLPDGGFVNNAKTRVGRDGFIQDIYTDGGLAGPCPTP